MPRDEAKTPGFRSIATRTPVRGGMNRLPTLRAWGAAAFEPAFARRMLRLRKTGELNATSCSNAPAGPPIQVVGAAGPVDKSTGLKPGPRKGTPKREGVNWLPLSTRILPRDRDSGTSCVGGAWWACGGSKQRWRRLGSGYGCWPSGGWGRRSIASMSYRISSHRNISSVFQLCKSGQNRQPFVWVFSG